MSKTPERAWSDMRERLMKLPMKQLKQIARDEKITLGYDASRKDTCVGAIVSARRHRIHELEADSEHIHPWRRYHSVNNMKPAGQLGPS